MVAQQTRRALFAAAPLALLAVSAPALAVASGSAQPGPMMKTFAEYERTRDWINAEPCWGAARDAEREAVHERLFNLEEVILDCRSPTKDAVEAQMRLIAYACGPEGASLNEETITAVAENVLAYLKSV